VCTGDSLGQRYWKVIRNSATKSRCDSEKARPVSVTFKSWWWRTTGVRTLLGADREHRLYQTGSVRGPGSGPFHFLSMITYRSAGAYHDAPPLRSSQRAETT